MSTKSTIDPLDVATRIDEFKTLADGWLDGKGLAPSHAGLDWLAGAFAQSYPDDLPPPYLYPTPEGGVQAEWSFRPHALSLEIDLTARTADWLSHNLDDDSDEARTLDLDDKASWGWVAGEVGRLAGVRA